MKNEVNLYLGDTLVDRLKGIGVNFPDDTAALIVIEGYLDAAGDLRAADALRFVRQQFQGDPTGVAVDRVLFGGEKSLRQAAKEVGISHEGLRKKVRRIFSKLPRALQCVSEVNNQERK